MSRLEDLKDELFEFLSLIDQDQFEDNLELYDYVNYLKDLLNMSNDKPRCLDYLNSKMLLSK